MAEDRYSALWVSHSSIGDFLKCPRLYFLRNVYKTELGRKINIASPSLSLGQAVHGVLERLAQYKAEERFKNSLEESFEKEWQKISGKRGGFKGKEEEIKTKERGKGMILRVSQNPGPLLKKTVKINGNSSGELHDIYLSKEDNIILCGKIDWLEYVDEDDSVRVIDFKTGRKEEDGNSLQLPIYLLLLNELQKRKVSGASYWYIDRDDTPSEVKLPNAGEAKDRVLFMAKKIKVAKENQEFMCPYGLKGCFACRPFEKILLGEAEFVGLDEYEREMYIV